MLGKDNDKKDEDTFLNNLESMKEKEKKSSCDKDGLNALFFTEPEDHKNQECSPNQEDGNNNLTAEENELY